MAIKERKISFIGGGHITELIVDNLKRTNIIPRKNLFVSDPKADRLDYLKDKYAINPVEDNLLAVERGDFIFVNVLPQVVENVLAELSGKESLADKLIITLAAGITIKKISLLGPRLAIVRLLPTPPSQYGMGIIPVAFNDFVRGDQREDLFELLASLGETVMLPEEKINAVTALSSPAPTYLYIQSMVEAGVKSGIDRETSKKIVSQTISGSLEVWKQRQVSPSVLLNEACSPGGISEESIATLEQCAFPSAIIESIQKGAKKADQFSHSS